MTENPPTIEDLIKQAEKKEIWIPEFQRPFVWDRNQVILLIDSLFNNYTISSILIWEGADVLSRRRVGGSISETVFPGVASSSKIVRYMLDGQQRTTALLLAFTDAKIYHEGNTKRTFNFNIFWDSAYEGDDPEERWLTDDDTVEYPDRTDESIQLKKVSESDLFQVFKGRYVKLKHVYKWLEESNNITELMNKDFDLLATYMKCVTTLRDKILSRIVTQIEQPGSLEQVLDVFERINTMNTKLNIFDIMVAKTCKWLDKDKLILFNLRDYMSIVNQTNNVKENYTSNLCENGVGTETAYRIIEDKDLLGLIAIMLGNKDDNNFREKAILKLTTDQLLQRVKYIHDGFHQIIQHAEQHFFIEYSEFNKYKPLIRFMTAFYAEYNGFQLEKGHFLGKWFWNTLLKNRYPGAQNEKLQDDLDIVRSHSLEVALTMMLKTNSISYSSIKDCTENNLVLIDAYRSASSKLMYRAMQLLLKSKRAKDFYNGMTPKKSGVIQYSLEEHHIFPENSTIGKQIIAKYKEHNVYSDVINNIANIALLTKETNLDIRAKNPSVYILELEKGYSNDHGKLHEMLESQFIDTEMIEALKTDNFEEFIALRTKKLWDRINYLCENGS